MKKMLKRLLITVLVLLAIIISGSTFLYFSSSKYQITHNEIERAYIYHNELEREIYVLTDEELSKVSFTVRKAKIGSYNDAYEAVDGGPWFSVFCELENGRTVQLYSDGINFFIDSVPVEVDADTANAFLTIQNEIEEKILPLSPELLEEINNKYYN